MCAIEVVGVDGGKGVGDGVSGGEDGVVGAPGFGAVVG